MILTLSGWLTCKLLTRNFVIYEVRLTRQLDPESPSQLRGAASLLDVTQARFSSSLFALFLKSKVSEISDLTPRSIILHIPQLSLHTMTYKIL